MPLDVPDGSDVFIDANIFHYALIPVDPFTSVVVPFIERLRSGTFTGFTTVQVLGDALHKTMLSLVAVEHKLNRANLLGWVKKHPDVLQKLAHFNRAVELLDSLPLSILPVDRGLLGNAAKLAQLHGLLTNDAMIVTSMRQHGLVNLASNDDDFARVPGLTLWSPRL